MQIKNKIFPYPVINHNKNNSCFNDYDFLIYYETSETQNAYILNNCRFNTDCALLNSLYEQGKISVALIIECSDTMYRKKIDIEKNGKKIELNKIDFTEKVDISMFAYAKENFILTADEIDEDYRGIPFEIDKYDIIGINDGFNIRFIHNEKEDNYVQSIFSIITAPDLENGLYLVDYCNDKKIVISLSKDDYDNYHLIYNNPSYKEVFFNMIIIPVLIGGLYYCKNSSLSDIDEIGNQFNWFRSVCAAYKNLKGEELTIESFNELNIVKFAQEIIGKPFGQALKSLLNVANDIERCDEDE